MRRVVALAVTVGVVSIVVSSGGPDLSPARATGLALGFALIAAALTGALFEKIHLPRVSGYLIFGLLCGPYLANIITRPMARDLQIVNGLAIALIALIAGLELNYARLRPRLGSMTKLALVTLVLHMPRWARSCGSSGPSSRLRRTRRVLRVSPFQSC